MSEVFVSYARSTEPQARIVVEALRSSGYNVWRDDQLPAHRAYGEVIEERLRSAKAVVVIWSVDAIRSQWVRAEADVAREAGTLVQLSIDGVPPPMPFNQIQCADLYGWTGDLTAPGWVKVESSVASLVGSRGSESGAGKTSAAPRKAAICVLPFINMSGDGEQEYFSDGISEDIITDLSKVSAMSVVARNTAFNFKGKTIDVKDVARQLNVTHVLEGSVRKAGGRVRITAQLVDGEAGDPVWADRYDRDLTDIFAIQDEISKAIVGALKLKLLPQEKKAIEQRGTTSPEAYNLYLLARRHWVDGSNNDHRRAEVVIRVCRQAIAVDPEYAQAWALMALAQTELRFWHARPEDGREAAERALAIDPNLAEAHCVAARYLQNDGLIDEANRQLETALRLDPESWEVNKEGAFLLFRQGRIADAIPYFEKAAALVEGDYHSAGMLMTCYGALKDQDSLLRAAKTTFARVERALAQDPTNSKALGLGAGALAVMGEAARTKEWIARAMLIDPDNILQKYNLACCLTAYLNDDEGALDLIASYFDQANRGQIEHAEVDPDMNRLRDHPRFKSMVATARARLEVTDGPEAIRAKDA
ncbi:TIR domain-containing protein [Phenylobacterium sp.]|uniref:TIR domain-containing protein n=1 Tax=Phenylobacterium sp. TaxID=1871053 RepID=UPI0039830A80